MSAAIRRCGLLTHRLCCRDISPILPYHSPSRRHAVLAHAVPSTWCLPAHSRATSSCEGKRRVARSASRFRLRQPSLGQAQAGDHGVAVDRRSGRVRLSRLVQSKRIPLRQALAAWSAALLGLLDTPAAPCLLHRPVERAMLRADHRSQSVRSQRGLSPRVLRCRLPGRGHQARQRRDAAGTTIDWYALTSYARSGFGCKYHLLKYLP